MLIDSHIHTHYSHGESEVYKMTQEAINMGIDGIGFAEHFHYDYFNDLGMPTVGGREVSGTVFENFKRYYKTAKKAKEDFKEKIKILIGVEVDFLEFKKDSIKQALDARVFANDYKEKDPNRKYEFDFVMGATHFIGEPLKYFSDYKENGDGWMVEEYFKSVKDSIKSRLFDVIAHPEIIKYFINKDFSYYSHHVEEIIDLLVKYNVAIDLNTDYSNNPKTGKFERSRINPGLEMLVLCRDKKVPFVLGSDAHSPNKIASNFIETHKILKSIGINKLFYFKNRKKVEYSI